MLGIVTLSRPVRMLGYGSNPAAFGCRTKDRSYLRRRGFRPTIIGSALHVGVAQRFYLESYGLNPE
jgi:hypothetical protein